MCNFDNCSSGKSGRGKDQYVGSQEGVGIGRSGGRRGGEKWGNERICFLPAGEDFHIFPMEDL